MTETDTKLNTSLPLLTLEQFKNKLREKLPGFVTDKIEMYTDANFYDRDVGAEITEGPNNILRGMILLPMVFSLKQPKAEGEFRLTDKLVDGIVRKTKQYYQLSSVEAL